MLIGKNERMIMGRKKLAKNLKAKVKSFRLYDWELEKVKAFIKELRAKQCK